MASTISEWIAQGHNIGVFKFYLPFVLSFAVFYGLLRKVKIFDGKKVDGKYENSKVGKVIDLIVSAILALLIMGYTPAGISLAEMFSSMFTETMIIVISLIGGLMVLSVLLNVAGIHVGGNWLFDEEKGKYKLRYPIVWVAFLFLTLIALAGFISSGGTALIPGIYLPNISFPNIPAFNIPALGLTSVDMVMIALVVLTLGIIIWVSRSEGS